MAISTIDNNGVNLGQLGNRNLIINGAMQVAQRGTSSTTDGYQTVDRFRSGLGEGTATLSQESLTSGDPYDLGFRKFHRITNTAGSSSNATRRRIYTTIEAQDLASKGWNYTSSSSYITLSFWVRSSLSGTYYIYLQTMDGTNKNYTMSFALTANTWTKVVKHISGDSGITINNDNGAGMRVHVMANFGTDFTGTMSTDTWGNMSNTNRTPDDTTGWYSTTGATYDITGVQLEVGDTATPFEHRSYGDELAKCQRYYYAFINAGSGGEAWVTTASCYNTTNAYGGVRFPVTMRTIPTLIQYIGTDVWQFYNVNSSDRFDSFTLFGSPQTTISSAMIYNTDTISITAGHSGNFQGGNTACYLHFDAEL